MDAHDYWKLFLDTGAPEMYLLYNNAKRMEQTHVLDDTGPGLTGHTLQ